MPPPRPALQHWPLFSLVLTTPRLELRLPWPDELDALASVAVRGVHPPDTMPFVNTWTAKPAGTVARSVFTHQWRNLGKWAADDWLLPLTVFAGGHPIGVQDISAADFRCVREVKTGSWLGSEYQGRGYGAEMRAAVLFLAFAGLDAQTARSEAFADNPASNSVSRRLGYREDGTEVYAVQEQRRISRRFVLDRAGWERHATVPVQLSGLEGALEMFGLDAGPQGAGSGAAGG